MDVLFIALKMVLCYYIFCIDIVNYDGEIIHMRILLDGMGGDNAPAEIVKGAIEALAECDYDITIIGREEDIYTQLEKYTYDEDRISVVNATQVIENEDSPVKSVRRKQDSSMVKGLNMLKEGKGDVFVSAGNTGAYMAGSLFILGRIPGIERPAIASIYPIIGGETSLIVDAGANSECKPRNLLDFGIMGSLYMEKVLGRRNAKVGLVNLGVEENKGTALTKEAFVLLKESKLNFVGNVEAREVPRGACDVIVCDGFTGNVILKLTEGFALNILKVLKKKLTEGLTTKMGALLVKGKLKELATDFNYEEYGGAPILGVNGHVVKMHGSSKAYAVKQTILKAGVYAHQNVVEQITTAMEELGLAE